MSYPKDRRFLGARRLACLLVRCRECDRPSGARHPGAKLLVLAVLSVQFAIGLTHPSHARLIVDDEPTLRGSALQILVFTRTEGFAHPSISDGVTMLEDIALAQGYTLVVSDQTDLFTPGSLASFDVVVWLSTIGDVLDDPEQAAFEGYMQAGGGYVGIHAAADCEYDWPWYGELLGNGAWFLSHPSIQDATLVLENAAHPGAGFTSPMTTFRDEWYNFRANPRPAVEVILTLDETSYNPGSGAMGADHPIAWAHAFVGGRAFYTGLGHRPETFQDPRFQAQIEGAIQWAAGLATPVFGDDFESGGLGAWNATVPASF